jgi:hypothetical protein
LSAYRYPNSKVAPVGRFTFGPKITEKMMKTDTGNATTHFSNVLLTGTLLLANVDVNGLVDYGLKALLGGAVWLGYKLTADYLDRRKKQKNNELN